MTTIRIGGVEVEQASALESARGYLTRRDRFGYPAYDGFSSEGGPWRISDADLVAPVLLNAPVNSRVFYALESIRSSLEAWLIDIPPDARLIEADGAGLAKLGELFSVLDSDDIPDQARGSILAKVMHRKRPAFIPLYDKFVDYCYRGADTAPITADRGRSWQDFMPLLGAAITTDLKAGADFLGQVAELATGPAITSLRALDIVAWYAGRSVIGAPVWNAATPSEDPELDDDDLLSHAELVSISLDDEQP